MDSPGARPLGDSLRVLVVDDDRAIATLHAAAARSVPGLNVVGVAYTARSALDLLDEHRVDLLLLDLGLPDAGGLTVLQQIRQQFRHHADVIIVTAAGDPATMQQAAELGVLHYLVKPCRLQVLIDRLREYQAGQAADR